MRVTMAVSLLESKMMRSVLPLPGQLNVWTVRVCSSAVAGVAKAAKSAAAAKAPSRALISSSLIGVPIAFMKSHARTLRRSQFRDCMALRRNARSIPQHACIRRRYGVPAIFFRSAFYTRRFAFQNGNQTSGLALRRGLRLKDGYGAFDRGLPGLQEDSLARTTRSA